jgi:hypothetical protein
MVDLGAHPSGYGYLPVLGMSADGQVIVGEARVSGSVTTWMSYRWQNGTYLELPLAPGAIKSTALGANANGSVICGSMVYPGSNNVHPYRWTAAGGTEDLGLPPGGIYAFPSGISGDGSVIAGTGVWVPGQPHAVIWTRARGIQDLNTLLSSMGINLNGMVLTEARAVSADGTVIVGVGRIAAINQSHGWVLDLRGDTDGDGLKDDWEINGIPYTDVNGAPQRYIVPGANPAHKDLYVEVDRMAGISVDNAAISLVVQAFADAPLANPDGVTGVTLHVEIDEGDLPYIEYWHTSNGCWPDDFNQDFMLQHYGTAAERADPRGLPLRIAKQTAYRYGVLSDKSDADLGGCGKIGGDIFTVYTGGVGPSTEAQATAFMHELGHNLGLRHGGADERNGKPNYPSIMNYVLAFKAPWNEDFWRLDYSRGGPEMFRTLSELHLDETAGVGGTLFGSYSNWVMPFGVNFASGGGRGLSYVRLAGTPADFGSPSGNGVPDGQFTDDVIQDLNYLADPPPGIHLPSNESPADTLEPYNDWEHVVLATYSARGPGAPLPSNPPDELTMSARFWMAQNFPLPGGPTPCYANCDQSTTVPVLNVGDFTCFLQRFAAGEPYANCDQSTIPPLLNVGDFTCFLQRFAAGCP